MNQKLDFLDESVERFDAQELIDRLEAGQWPKEREDAAFRFLAHKGEFSGRLFQSYDCFGNKWSGDGCASEYLARLGRMLLSRVVENGANGASPAESLRLINAALKLLDRSGDGDLTEQRLQSVSRIVEIVQHHRMDCASGDEADTPMRQLSKKDTAADIIPLTVLFYEGPIARAYLATLRACGVKPQKIIKLISKTDLATGKTAGRLFPGHWKTRYRQFLHRERAHYWTKALRNKYPAAFQSIKRSITSEFGFDEQCFEESYALLPLSGYSDNVMDVPINGLSDPYLEVVIKAESGLILYTGGGIVPKRLLAVDSVTFLHVHPGYLPDFRGADCTLWSWLITGRAAASLFKMAPGIDDGDIILRRYLPSARAGCADIKLQDKYRSVYAYYDPWVRAAVLKEALYETNYFSQVTATQQRQSQGTTYKFMHSALRDQALAAIFS